MGLGLQGGVCRPPLGMLVAAILISSTENVLLQTCVPVGHQRGGHPPPLLGLDFVVPTCQTMCYAMVCSE